ncbi:MAG: aminomethyl-transferring glycine dehydrogenase subunit GcvPA [Deltaproteobacteria bacterium]|nr:aminomethyl-transferring glycine dehydrogenase subunit GcvPA [Deltaproteobacteria bacterium]
MKKQVPYIATTEADRSDMLAEIGVREIDELFGAIPDNLRLTGDLTLPSPIEGVGLPLSEIELTRYMGDLSARNSHPYTYFLGAGCYYHYVPSIVDLFVNLPHFYTPYTPYKPETNQGTLQAMYEYQTMMCRLTGLEVSNASLYDGATAMVEAAKMASRLTGRTEIVISRTVHPEYRQTLETYFRYGDWQIVEVGIDGGKTDMEELAQRVSDRTAAVIVQSPNFFGILEDMGGVAEAAHTNEVLFIYLVVEALSLALIQPAEFGADIVAGEAQSFGTHMSYGGPHLGFINCYSKHKSKLPGRIVTKTEDIEGSTAYMLWGAAREQHISRSRATSNICTNHALNALAASIYLSWYGSEGLKELADIHNVQMANYAHERLGQIPGYEPAFPGEEIFNEFVLTCPHEVGALNRKLLDHSIIGGLDVGRFYPEYTNKVLFCITEKTGKDDIDGLADILTYLKNKGFE